MSQELVGVKLEVDGSDIEQTVGELRKSMADAINKATQIGEEFGKSSKQFKDAQAQVKAIGKALQDAGADANDVETPIKGIRTRLKEAKEELIRMQEQFGELSPEALNAARNVATLTDQIQEANEVSQLFDPGKTFQAVTGVATTITAGFAAAQGGMALFGVESKEVEKALLKVQAAMALSQGLSAVKDGYKDFQRLGIIIKSTTLFQAAYNFVMTGTVKGQQATTVAVGQNTAALQVNTGATIATATATGTATTALKIFRAALLTTGIGALVILIGYLISSIVEYTSSSKDAAEGQKILNEELERQIDITQKVIDQNEKLRNSRSKEENFGTAGIDVLQRELELMKARGASAAELFKKEQEIRMQERTNLRIQGETWVEFYNVVKNAGLLTLKAQEDLKAKVDDINKQGLDKKTEMEAAATTFAKEKQQKRDAAALSSLNRAEELAKARVQGQIDAEQKIFAIQQEYGKRREGLLAAILSHDKSNASAREALYSEQAKNQTARLSKEGEYSKEILAIQQQLNDELFASNHTAQEKELRDLAFKFATRVQAYQKAGADTKPIVEAWEKEETQIVKKYAKDKQAARDAASSEEAAALNEHIGSITGAEYDGLKQVLENVKSTESDKLAAEAQNYQLRLEELTRFHEQIMGDTNLNAEDRFKLLQVYETAHTQLERDNAEARKQIAADERDARAQASQSVGNALIALGEIAGEQTLANKILAIAGATINTFAGAAQVLGAPSSIPEPYGTIVKIASAAAIVANGLVQVKKIAAVQVPGKGGGGGGGVSGGAPIAPNTPQAQTTQLNQDSINSLNNATVKAIVVESDITGSQDRINRIHNAAKLR